MKRNIAVFTGTRADYGLLHWLMKDIQADSDLSLQVIVGAMHLSPEFGETWQEIAADGFSIDAKVEMILSSDTPVGVVKSMGLGLIGFADALDRLRPDLLVVLGDRFEAMAIVQAALILRIPIAHIHGGEVTEGAYDDAIRHSISKMANLHFVAAAPYARRVIQLGENPERVFNVGAVGLDSLKRGKSLPLDELGRQLDFEFTKPFFLATYHPVTMADEDPAETCGAMLRALDNFDDYQVILTYPNADNGGRAIIPLVEAYAKNDSERVLAIPSLGFTRYKAALSKAAAMIGNSSSGIIEAPSFGVPTVNIGDRQLGRICASSVYHSAPNTEAITNTITKAISKEGQINTRAAINPYGMGDASGKILSLIKANTGPFSPAFYDLEIPK